MCVYTCAYVYIHICVRVCVCVELLNRSKTSTVSSFSAFRGKRHAIRDHVQQSYLQAIMIAWDTEPDQLCVPAPFSSLHGERPSQ